MMGSFHHLKNHIAHVCAMRDGEVTPARNFLTTASKHVACLSGLPQDLVKVGERLGIDPFVDSDLGWIVEEYLEAPLPEEWTVVKFPNAEIHFINQRSRGDMLENPIEPRYRKLVKLVKMCKAKKRPNDEVTVMELMDPIERVADVKDMAEYMGIDRRREVHLVWIAKLSLLEPLPDGWEETQAADGRVLYLNQAKGYSTEEHPMDNYFKALLERERKKRPPAESLASELYEIPVARFRNDQAADGSTLRTEVVPATGGFVDMYDMYGTRFWYNLITEQITFDVKDVKMAPAILTIQRIFRGHSFRAELYAMHIAAKRICVLWRTIRFRRVLAKLEEERLKSVLLVQRRMRHIWVVREFSRLVFKRLGELGQRRAYRGPSKTAALQRGDGLHVPRRAQRGAHHTALPAPLAPAQGGQGVPVGQAVPVRLLHRPPRRRHPPAQLPLAPAPHRLRRPGVSPGGDGARL